MPIELTFAPFLHVLRVLLRISANTRAQGTNSPLTVLALSVQTVPPSFPTALSHWPFSGQHKSPSSSSNLFTQRYVVVNRLSISRKFIIPSPVSIVFDRFHSHPTALRRTWTRFRPGCFDPCEALFALHCPSPCQD